MNAIVAEKEADNVHELRAVGPGGRLRSARIAMGLDLAKAAEKLHLTSDVVDAIECDDYAEMPARIFALGYIRNYARLVELPVESIVAQFEELWPEDTGTVAIDRAPRLPSDTYPGGGTWGRLLTWLVGLAIVGLFFLWWAGHLDGLLKDAKAPLEATPDMAVPAPTELLPPVAELKSDPEPESAAPAAPGVLLLPPASEPVGQALSEPAEISLSTSPNTPESVEPSESVDAQQSAAAAVSPEPASNAASPVEPELAQTVEKTAVEKPAVEKTSAPMPVVTMTFKADCWVNIKAEDGSFRLLGTQRKGTMRTLGGVAPYRMIIGNAPAVELQIDGKVFDLAPHTRQNVARLTIPL